MADHSEFRGIIKNALETRNVFDEALEAAVKIKSMQPLPSADDIEEITENSTKNVTAPKPSNEEIALRLVEAWARQDGCPARFESVMGNYFEALDRLAKEESS